MLTRSVFHVELVDEDGIARDYAVDLNYLSWDGMVHFYVDGRQELVSEQPTAFPVPGGIIEVLVGASGLRRMHLVPDDGGQSRVLTPVAHSAEYWRAVTHQRHPRLSRWVGRVAIAILLIGVVLFPPQLLEAVTEWHVIADRFGTYSSPIVLPGWLTTTLLIAGLAAALERALMLRSHWLIDLKPWWLG